MVAHWTNPLNSLAEQMHPKPAAIFHQNSSDQKKNEIFSEWQILEEVGKPGEAKILGKLHQKLSQNICHS